MKTVKIKIAPTIEQQEFFKGLLVELSWLWNKVLASELGNHSLKWYSWAIDKSGKEGWGEFNFDGVIPVPLRFGKSAWIGASCTIARGGAYWKRDESINVAIKDKKGRNTFQKGYKLVEGDHPWERIEPVAYTPYVAPDGKEMKSPKEWDNLTRLNQMRLMEGYAPLSLHSDLIGGLLGHLETTLKEWLSPKNLKAMKPKFRHEKSKVGLIDSLYNRQTPPNFDDDFISVSVRAGRQKPFELQTCDRSWKKRIPDGWVPASSYVICKRASGWYICVPFASPEKAQMKKLEKAKVNAKKVHGEDSLEYRIACEVLESNKRKVEMEGYIHRTKHLSTGIDPGVKAVIATDHGALVSPNLAREKVSVRIEFLQAEFDRIKDLNDRQWKEAGKTGQRPLTKNELKLRQKISRAHEKGANSANAFNHKLSTRLVKTYSTIAWEDTQLTNLLKQVEPKANEEGVGYAKNGASAKRGLNWSLRQRSLGDLKAKVKSKLKTAGGKFIEPPAAYSSSVCSSCQQKGDRTEQHLFVCLNPECTDYQQPKQADVNAARNHLLNAGLSVGAIVYRTEKLSYKRPKRRKDGDGSM